MTRRLKRAIAFYGTSGIVITTPVVASIVMTIIGATYWNWEGRGFLCIVAGAAVSGTLFAFFLGISDHYENDIHAWIKEPEVKKAAPKAGAWHD